MFTKDNTILNEVGIVLVRRGKEASLECGKVGKETVSSIQTVFLCVTAWKYKPITASCLEKEYGTYQRPGRYEPTTTAFEYEERKEIPIAFRSSMP